jgi:hypothetical protein
MAVSCPFGFLLVLLKQSVYFPRPRPADRHYETTWDGLQINTHLKVSITPHDKNLETHFWASVESEMKRVMSIKEEQTSAYAH